MFATYYNMEDLQKLYDQLNHASAPLIASGKYSIDKCIDDPSDRRFGVTLLFRPDATVQKEMMGFLDKLQKIEPNQYYYPSADLHVTILSVISCYEGFQLSRIPVQEYIQVIRDSISEIPAFEVAFRGVTLSPSGLLVQGFSQNDSLEKLRNILRSKFRRSGLQESIDKRYTLKTAHTTVFRFRERLGNKEAFTHLMSSCRDHYFGKSTVSGIELVFNDWYLRSEKVKLLHEFELK